LIKADYICKKEKTQIQNVPESCLVAGTEKMSNQIISDLEKFDSLNI